MKKDEVDTILREYVKRNLSPKEWERERITQLYKSVQDVLGVDNCLQIGSYPRFTSITPVHDLDILYILGPWNPTLNAEAILNDLLRLLQERYKNLTSYDVEIQLQNHSVTIKFFDGREEKFSIDVVPAFISGRNEFGDDTYVVPEVVVRSRGERAELERAISLGRSMGWLRSDPRGYIRAARALDESNSDFRRTVKFVKGWRKSFKKIDEQFPLKSFHVEQIVTDIFNKNPSFTIFDGVFHFFEQLPIWTRKARITDRADSRIYIDEYINSISHSEKSKINLSRDHFLIELEKFSSPSSVKSLMDIGFYERPGGEQFLFDRRTPVLIEETITIRGEILDTHSATRLERYLDSLGLIQKQKKIRFRVNSPTPTDVSFRWKVKNDHTKCEQPRGEITEGTTRNDPETAIFDGTHYVECYAIRNNVCIGRARINVRPQ